MDKRQQRKGEGRRVRHRPFVAMVEGEQRGVPFRTFYKTMPAAERDAIATGGTLTDLITLKRRTPIVHSGNGWRQIEWRDA